MHHVGGHKVLDLGGLTLLGGSGGDFLSFLNSGGLGAELGVILLSGHAGFVFSVVLTVDGIFIAGIVSFLTGSSLVFTFLSGLGFLLGFGAVSGEMSFLTAVVARSGLSGLSLDTGGSLLLGGGAVSGEVTFLVAVSAGLSSGGTGLSGASLSALLLGLGQSLAK